MEPANLTELFQRSSSQHDHLCPRQILGVRMGLAGMKSLAFEQLPAKKRLLIIAETDGCFVDGLSAATGCTLGHRTLRLEDYGKIAAVFVDTQTGRSVRLAPAPDIRQLAYRYAPHEPRHYFAQMIAYPIMPDELLFTVQPVVLNVPVAVIVSHPGVRVNCDSCGEEIVNEREIKMAGLNLCRACAHGAYYTIDRPFDTEQLLYQVNLATHSQTARE